MRRFASTLLASTLLTTALAAEPVSAAEPAILVTAVGELELERARERARSRQLAASGPEAVARISAATTNEPSSERWLVPFLVDTGNPSGATTLLSVTNEQEIPVLQGPTNTFVEFHDAFDVPFHSEAFSLSIGELRSFNVRDQPNLPAGRALGFVEVQSAAGSLPSVDYYQVTPDQDFATGGQAFLISDFCSRWRARVLIGGPFTGGTNLLFVVNGPQGVFLKAPFTIVGAAYNESGALVEEFGIKTDAYIFEVDVADLISAPTLFGYLELYINSQFENPPGGYVIVNTGAEGRYSVGSSGVCLDNVPLPAT